MSKYIKIVALTLSIGISGVSWAQEQENIVDRNLTEQLKVMDQGVELMNQGKFAKADTYFLRVLETVEVVPADLCFYFGKNSYHLEKYKQSIDWLNKYMELKGTRGRFFDQAVEYLELAKADYASESTVDQPAVTEYKPKPKPFSLDCTKTPFVRCPVCQGEGVIVESGKLGSSVYKTCPYSDDSGRMTCTDYQKYLRGELRATNATNK